MKNFSVKENVLEYGNTALTYRPEIMQISHIIYPANPRFFNCCVIQNKTQFQRCSTLLNIQMITDAVKDYLVRKRFGIVSYLCVIVHFLCGLVFTVCTAVLSDSEIAKFSCSVDAKSTNVHKKQVDQLCFTRYDQAYNSPLPLYGFVLLSIGSGILVSVIYSQIVGNRVDQIESSHERQNGGEGESQDRNRRMAYVFYSYFFHLVLRTLLGIIFTVLQYTYFYSNGFPFKFKCNYNSTMVSCENATASRKRLSGILVCVTNSIVAFVIFVEVIYLLRRLVIHNYRHRHEAGWNVDNEFVTVYFLGKRYINQPGECIPLVNIPDSNPHENSVTETESNVQQHRHSTGNNNQDFVPRENSVQSTSVEDNAPRSNIEDNSIPKSNVEEDNSVNNNQDFVPRKNSVQLTSVEDNAPSRSDKDNSIPKSNVEEHNSVSNNQDFVPYENIVQLTSVKDNAPSSSIEDNSKSNVEEHGSVSSNQNFLPDEHVPLVSIENNTPDSNTQDYSIPDGKIQDTRVTEPNVQEHSTGNNDLQDSRNLDSSIRDNPLDPIAQECTGTIQHFGTHDPIQFYKTQVLDRPRAPEINYLQKTSVDDFYIDVVIHTERARHKFSKDMERHEIYDVYTKVPPTSILLEKIKDLFYPNKDTEGKVPRSILAIGRPGIGKTVFTEKIIRDWASSVDECYDNKIAIIFKFRWFNGNIKEFTNTSLEKFLQLATRLSDEEFERIYKEITKKPQRTILIFDGLDEFYGNYMHCLDEASIIPNDPNTRMSAMNLFVKLFQGNMLKGATILVTSRPTADDFYSKLKFDREVEILGFTRHKIEEYVIRFCNNNNTSDLKPKIWQHVKSNSELLNLCYIPVNCFIVCVTLSGYLIDAQNNTSALPTTLTELYLAALRYFEKYEHNRNADGHHIMRRETLKKLQQLAFLGMERGQLIFDQELLDEQMVKSCLLNSLSDITFPIQAQFCFIHLTIQEFLAARHVTETHDASEIKEFISDHVASIKWHLVLQFTAGLLGRKMKMSDQKLYKDCVLAFANILEVTDDIISLSSGNDAFVMKCLREGDFDNEIVQEICKTTGMSNATSLHILPFNPTPSECAAVTFICKHLENLAQFTLFGVSSDSFQEVEKLLQERCLNTLQFFHTKVEPGRVFSALTKLNCKLNHNHTNLTSLLFYTTSFASDVDVSNMYSFFSNEKASHLKTLYLSLEKHPGITSKLCEVFNNDYCTELEELILAYATAPLWDTLRKGLCKLTTLIISGGCLLTDHYTEKLCNALQDERCQLTFLELNDQDRYDKEACMLFEDGLINEHCKLTKLNLINCFLTDQCIPSLCKALQDEHCRLTDLSLWGNRIGDKCACTLFEDALTKEHCKLTKLDLGNCSLTDQCIPSLCKALQNELCPLTELSMKNNVIGDKGACMLFQDGLTKEHCKLTELDLVDCSLTDQCIPSLCKALQDEVCRLADLSLRGNDLGDKGASTLFEDALTKEHCKLTKLNLERCMLTDRCIPSLLKALQDEHCGLDKLPLWGNHFTKDGERSICEVDNTSKRTVVNWE